MPKISILTVAIGMFVIFQTILHLKKFSEKKIQIPNGGFSVTETQKNYLHPFSKVYWGPYKFTVCYVCFGKTSKLPWNAFCAWLSFYSLWFRSVFFFLPVYLFIIEKSTWFLLNILLFLCIGQDLVNRWREGKCRVEMQKDFLVHEGK